MYSSWSPWSTCSTSCGSGVQARTQTNCTGDCGPTCGAPSNQTQPCTNGVPYYLSAWSDWGNCSQYCGSGVQTRNQTCLGTCANSTSSCQGGAVSNQTTTCTGGRTVMFRCYVLNKDTIRQPECRSSGRAGGHSATAAQCNTLLRRQLAALMLFSCGQGNYTRSRICSGNCYDCPGNSTDTQPCQLGGSSSMSCIDFVISMQLLRERGQHGALGRLAIRGAKLQIIAVLCSLNAYAQLRSRHAEPHTRLRWPMRQLRWLSRRLTGLRDQ